MTHGVDGLGALFSKSIDNNGKKSAKKEDNEILFDDFSSKMQDSYNFSEQDSELVFNILQNADSKSINDEDYNNALKLFN